MSQLPDWIVEKFKAWESGDGPPPSHLAVESWIEQWNKERNPSASTSTPMFITNGLKEKAAIAAAKCQAIGFDGEKCVQHCAEMVKLLVQAERTYRRRYAESTNELTTMETPYTELLAKLKG